MCGFIEQQLRGCGEKHRQSWALSLVWSVLLCVHGWNTSTPTVGGFRASLAWFWWHMFLFLGSAEWSQSVYPAWRMAVCFLRESVLSVCLSVCLWLGGRASQETAHKHTDTHRVFVSCLNKGGRWGFVAAGGSVVLIRPSVSSPCRIPVSVIESRSETTTSNRPHNNTLIEISPETILRVVSIETESLCVFVQGNIFILGVHSRSCPWLTLSNWILVYLTGHPGRSHSRASQVSFSVLCFKHDLRTLKRPHCRSHWCHMACAFQLNTQNLKIS